MVARYFSVHTPSGRISVMVQTNEEMIFLVNDVGLGVCAFNDQIGAGLQPAILR